MSTDSTQGAMPDPAAADWAAVDARGETASEVHEAASS